MICTILKETLPSSNGVLDKWVIRHWSIQNISNEIRCFVAKILVIRFSYVRWFNNMRKQIG